MARREEWSVKELTIVEGGGIRAGVGQKLAKMIRIYRSVPAAKVANRYFASAAMHLGAYTIANSGLPGDGLAHNVTCTETITDAAEDTNGTLIITGTDIDGRVVSETITPNGGAEVATAKAFKKVTSIVGAGWVQQGATPDTIVIGFGDVLGLPEKIAAATDILFVIFGTAVTTNTTTKTVSAVSLANNTVTLVGDATKEAIVVYQI